MATETVVTPLNNLDKFLGGAISERMGIEMANVAANMQTMSTGKCRTESKVSDGLRRCPLCGEPQERYITDSDMDIVRQIGPGNMFTQIFAGKNVGDRLPVQCKCQRDEEIAEYERKAREEENRRRVIRLRERGIADGMCLSMRFENDKGYNDDVFRKARNYVEKWPEMKERNIGILFTGSVGTGKTFYAACIANALIDAGVFALMTSLIRIIRTPFGQYENVLRNIEDADLVVFDDIGAERDTSFAWERAFDAVDARIRAQKPMIVTTNLSPSELANASDKREQRIFDRIIGACVVIPVTGKSIRMREQQDKAAYARAALSGKDGITE